MMEFMLKRIESNRQLINEIGYDLFHGFEDEATREKLAASLGECIARNYTRRVLVAERCER